MPRDIGTGIYRYPDGTLGNPGQTIFSTRYNTFLNDLTNTLNQPLPINMGGTGADSATAARANLSAEVRGVQVTNYDTQVWEAGSFWSDGAATGGPVSGHGFAGIAYMYDTGAQFMALEARDLSETTLPGRLYIREKQSGVWGAWKVDGRSTVSDGDGIAAVTGDMWYGVRGTAPTSKFAVNSKSDLSGTDLFVVTKAGIAGVVGAFSAGTLTLSSSTAAASYSLFRGGASHLVVSGGSGGHQWNNEANTVALMTLTNAGHLTIAGNAGLGFDATSGGIPGYGTAATGTAIYPYGRVAASGTASAGIWNVNTDAYMHEFRRSGTLVGNIYVTTTATAYNTSSDERLKEDLKSFDAGNIVDDTNVYDFAWKSTGERAYGVIAQQAIEIYPAAITHTEKDEKSGMDEWWGVDYSKYVPVILQELKALRARVAELEASLEGKPA